MALAQRIAALIGVELSYEGTKGDAFEEGM
jgi:hypothetical protein